LREKRIWSARLSSLLVDYGIPRRERFLRKGLGSSILPHLPNSTEQTLSFFVWLGAVSK